MGHKKFDDFVDKQSQQKGFSEAERQQALRDWIAAINEFYEMIDAFLEPYTESGKIRVERSSKRMHEDLIGNYEAPTYVVKIGQNNNLRLEPVGYFVIGAKGRIDLLGPRGNVRFVRLDKSISVPQVMFRINSEVKACPNEPEIPVEKEWVWKIATKPPQIKFIDISADIFFDALMKISNV